MEDEKAASRAAWNRHQRFVRQKKRGRGGGGGRVGSRRHVLDEVVKEQGRHYDEEECDTSAVVEGDDYEEWLSSCPKEMPLLLRRQRVGLPDVSFLLSRMEGNLSGLASSEEETQMDLGVLAAILDRLPDSVRLEIPVEICSMLNIEDVRSSYRDDVVARDSFALKKRTGSVLDGLRQQSSMEDQVEEDHIEEKVEEVEEEKIQESTTTLADDLDALLDLGNPLVRQSSAMIGQGEEEDLDAWFDAL